MNEQKLLKVLLDNDFFVNNKHKLSRNFFEREAADIYDTISKGHEKYDRDLDVEDVKALHGLNNPTQTVASKEVTDLLLNSIKELPPYDEDIAQDILASAHKAEVGRTVAHFGIDLVEGKEDSLVPLLEYIENIGEDFVVVKDYEFITTDFFETCDFFENRPSWKFNLPPLAKYIPGMSGGQFMVVIARPEVGKTAFPVSLTAAPEGFAEQGAKVCFVCNEEMAQHTIMRSIQAATGKSKNYLISMKEHNQEDLKDILIPWYKIRDNIRFINNDTLNLDDLESFIKSSRPDILIIDQLDKIELLGYTEDHRKFKELYRRVRNLAKKYDCLIIGVSQASADAEGVIEVTYAYAEGSKTGKAAECDVFLGIGARKIDTTLPEDLAPMRYITISKNKITGRHERIPCSLDIKLSRYGI